MVEQNMSDLMAKIATENAARKLDKKAKKTTKILKVEGEEGTAAVGKAWGIYRKKSRDSAQVPGVGTVDVAMGNTRPKNPRSVENQE